jgi:uncharacterized protein (TIGR02598 family)
MTFIPASFTRSNTAFSLVEVTISLGLFAFVLVTLLGLMPVALKAGRDSLDMAAAVQMADGLAAKLQQDGTPPPASTMRYYDDEGTELTDPAQAIYQVRVDSADADVDYLKKVTITVNRNTHIPVGSFCYLIFMNP